MSQLLDHALLNAGAATMLALLVGGVSLIFRRPALLHCLWLLVLLKLVTPPILPVSIPVPTIVNSVPETQATTPNGSGIARETATTENPASQASDNSGVSWMVEIEPSANEASVNPAYKNRPTAATFSMTDTIAMVWLTGSCVWLSWALYHIVWFQRLLRHARPAPRHLQERVKLLGRALGLKTPPPMLLVPGAVSPLIWAFGTAPRLIFPARLLDRLDDEQFDALVIHELAHVLRRDHWVRGLELVVTALFWWHPVLWWAKREIHETEEQCCDAWVVWASAGGSRGYALALVQAVEFCTQARAVLPAAASGIGPVPHLRRRLTMIMQGTTPRSLSWAGACAVLGLGMLLPLAPTSAQAASDADEATVAPDDRDQQIEVLKRAIKALEDQKKSAKPGQPDRPKANAADIEKAKKEVERRERDVTQKRNELHEAEQRLHEAWNRLQGAEGKPALPEEKRIRLNVHPELPGSKPRVIQVKPGEEPRAITLPKDGPGSEHRVIVVPDGQSTVPHRVRVYTDLAPGEHGKMDLEQRLQRLLQEVEEIKREMRREPRPESRPRTPPPQAPRPPTPGARVGVDSPVVAPVEVAPGAMRLRVAPLSPPTPATPPGPPTIGGPPSVTPAPALPPTPAAPPAPPPPAHGDSDGPPATPLPPPPSDDGSDGSIRPA